MRGLVGEESPIHTITPSSLTSTSGVAMHQGSRMTAPVRIISRSALIRRPAQQPESIGDHQQARANVGGNGHPEVGQPEYSQDQDQDLGQECNRDVLADAGECRPALTNEPGEPAEIVGEEDDIGGFERGPAGDASERDTDLGGGQGRGVIDAVADHAGGAMAGVELGDCRDLIGCSARATSPTPSSTGHGGGGACVVAGEHDGLGA